MTQSIYSSKLYKSSKRRDRIQAALLAAGNQGLVQQLAEDLDDEYQKPEIIDPESTEVKTEEEPVEEPEAESELEVDGEDNEVLSLKDAKKLVSDHPSHSPKSDTEDPMVLKDDDVPPEVVPEDKPEPKKEPESVDSATRVVTTVPDIDLEAVKGSLNARAETAGVSRVADKSNEVWIYYKDDVNLNNVMVDVIELLSNSGYITLEFNRLARTDNAIVFEKIKEATDIQAVNAGSKIAPVENTQPVSNTNQENQENKETDIDEAIDKIRKTEGDMDEVKQAVKTSNGIHVTFSKHKDVDLSSDDIASGNYLTIVEKIVNGGKSVRVSGENRPFEEVLNNELK